MRFATTTLTTDLSSNYATTWSNSYSVSKTVKVKCKQLPDGSTNFELIGLYQMKMETEEEGNPAQNVTWNPSYFLCADSTVTPICPPGIKCLNNSCTECDWDGEVELPEDLSMKTEL